METKHYVVGFAFTPDFGSVLLIRKARPPWMAGKWNGLGGKIEPGESNIDAMVREFREECGLESENPWVHVASWRGVHHEGFESLIHFFYTCTYKIVHAKSTTDEQVQIIRVRDLQSYQPVIHKLHWLIPFCKFFATAPEIGKPVLPLQIEEQP